MDPTLMLEGHLYATKERIKETSGEWIVVSQDTTSYNYTTHPSMEGLGKIQGDLKGILQHNLLACSENGIPLGLLGQLYWSRGSESVLPYEGKESDKWLWGLKTVNEEISDLGKRVVLVQDREADIYSFFQAERAASVDLIVRVHEPRHLETVEAGEVYKLPEIGERLPVLGEKQIKVFRQGREVTLILTLQAAEILVLAGKKNRAEKSKTEGLYLVIARETDALDSKGKSVYDEKESALWYLLTSLKAIDQNEIERVVDFYAMRWRIERLHYALKTGAFNVEKRQFDDLKTTVNALAFYSIAAWRILAIVYLTREKEDQPATTCFEKKEIKVLERVSRKKLKTVKEATLALAKLNGFAPSRRQPMPGIKLLAQCIEMLYYIKLGFNAKPT
jgi:hypothetical protein